jgi:hypothetical protein
MAALAQDIPKERNRRDHEKRRNFTGGGEVTPSLIRSVSKTVYQR